METIGLILVRLLAVGLCYFAVDRLGRSLDQNLLNASRRGEDDPACRDQADPAEKADDCRKDPGKQ